MRYLFLASLLMLGACAQTASSPTSTAALQQKVLAAEAVYEAPLRVAVAYNQRPRCTTPRTIVLCSDAVVVDQMRRANHAVMEAFSEAMKTASTPGVSEDKVTAAIVVATNAASALQTITNIYTK